MPDREKVINGLHDLRRYLEDKEWSDKTAGLYLETVTDTITMLKEQEAVEPSFKQDEKGIFVWCCGSCGAYMYHIYDGIDKAKEYAKFCRQCGRSVKW